MFRITMDYVGSGSLWHHHLCCGVTFITSPCVQMKQFFCSFPLWHSKATKIHWGPRQNSWHGSGMCLRSSYRRLAIILFFPHGSESKKGWSSPNTLMFSYGFPNQGVHSWLVKCLEFQNKDVGLCSLARYGRAVEANLPGSCQNKVKWQRTYRFNRVQMFLVWCLKLVDNYRIPSRFLLLSASRPRRSN